MEKRENITFGGTGKKYVSPKFRQVMVAPRRVMCWSPEEQSMYENDGGDGGFSQK